MMERGVVANDRMIVIMRVLYLAPSLQAYNSAWHEHNIFPVLKKIDPDLIYINPLQKGFISPEQTHEYIRTQFNRAHSKSVLFFSLTTDDFLFPETITWLKEQGAITVNYTMDNLDQSSLVRKIAPHFDVYCVSEPEAVPLLQKMGAHSFLFPMAANPNIYKPYDVSEQFDVSFCGTKNSSRPFYIYQLLAKSNFHWALGGSGWANNQESASSRAIHDPLYTLKYIYRNLNNWSGVRNIMGDALNTILEPKPSSLVIQKISEAALPQLSFTEYIKLYAQSRLALGINEKGNSYHFPHPIFQMRLRDFEAPMSGACYLMRRLPDAMEYFEEDKEMLFYSSIEEIIAKISYYSNSRHDSLRQKIRLAARKRSLRQHTWEHRFASLFAHLGIEYHYG
jgi:spore maturation protein CgeB